jgi:hypothetical protein
MFVAVYKNTLFLGGMLKLVLSMSLWTMDTHGLTS